MRVAVALLAVLAVLAPKCALAKELKISHQWVAEVDARDRAARIFVREVQSRLPEMSFQIYPQLALKLKAEQQFDALQSAKIEMSVYPLPYAVKRSLNFPLPFCQGYFRVWTRPEPLRTPRSPTNYRP